MPVWPVRGRPIGWPVATSHSRTVPSSLPLARVLPSGLNATEQTRAGVAGEGAADRVAGGHVPQPHRVIVAAAGQGLAVGAERHRPDGAGVAGEGAADRVAGGHVPQPHRAIVAAAGQGLAVRAERHREDRAGVAGEGVPDLVAGGHIPQPHRAIASVVGTAAGQRSCRPG